MVLWALAFCITLWGTWYALNRFSTSPQVSTQLPPVSILKPIKGVDAGLSFNLESFFHLNYPHYEIIFSVGAPTDPAIPIVEDLIRLYPEVPAQLVVGEINLGVNPKVNNLVRSYELAKFDTVLISDSNVRVPPDYLSRLVPHLTGDVGIATSVVMGTQAQNMGGNLEATYLNTFYARWMHVSAVFGYPAVVGKSMFFKKSTLRRLGGLKTLSQYIAEDYMAGVAVQRLGLKVSIVTDPVPQFIGTYSFRAFWSRHVRWGRIRKSMAPLAFVIEPIFGAFVSGIVGGIAFSRILGVPYFLFLGLHLFFWALCDTVLLIKLKQWTPKSVVLWFFREILAIPMWIHILIGNTVEWRGRRYKLLSGGILAED